jgi:hypothetical protein
LLFKKAELPVHIDTSFCKHQVPEVQERLESFYCCKAVVNEHTSIGNPQSSENEDHTSKHLDHLEDKCEKIRNIDSFEEKLSLGRFPQPNLLSWLLGLIIEARSSAQE